MAAPSASDMVVVVTGGDPVDPTHLPELPGGRPGDRGRLRRRARARRSACRRPRGRRLRLGLAGGAGGAPTAAGASIERHPAAKDATDLELALDAALALGAPTHPRARRPRRAARPPARQRSSCSPARARRRRRSPPRWARRGSPSCATPATLRGPVGDLVTLLPVHGPARGVTTSGLLYPLAGEDLPAGTTRGVSNELVHDPATVTLADGRAAWPSSRASSAPTTRRTPR